MILWPDFFEKYCCLTSELANELASFFCEETGPGVDFFDTLKAAISVLEEARADIHLSSWQHKKICDELERLMAKKNENQVATAGNDASTRSTIGNEPCSLVEEFPIEKMTKGSIDGSLDDGSTYLPMNGGNEISNSSSPMLRARCAKEEPRKSSKRKYDRSPQGNAQSATADPSGTPEAEEATPIRSRLRSHSTPPVIVSPREQKTPVKIEPTCAAGVSQLDRAALVGKKFTLRTPCKVLSKGLTLCPDGAIDDQDEPQHTRRWRVLQGCLEVTEKGDDPQERKAVKKGDVTCLFQFCVQAPSGRLHMWGYKDQRTDCPCFLEEVAEEVVSCSRASSQFRARLEGKYFVSLGPSPDPNGPLPSLLRLAPDGSVRNCAGGQLGAWKIKDGIPTICSVHYAFCADDVNGSLHMLGFKTVGRRRKEGEVSVLVELCPAAAAAAAASAASGGVGVGVSFGVGIGAFSDADLVTRLAGRTFTLGDEKGIRCHSLTLGARGHISGGDMELFSKWRVGASGDGGVVEVLGKGGHVTTRFLLCMEDAHGALAMWGPRLPHGGVEMAKKATKAERSGDEVQGGGGDGGPRCYFLAEVLPAHLSPSDPDFISV